MTNPNKIKELIDNKAFYYISPSDVLELSENGDVLMPNVVGGSYSAKAFWVKDSPQQVWLFEDVSKTKEAFIAFLESALKRGATEESVRHHGLGAGLTEEEIPSKKEETASGPFIGPLVDK